MLFKKKENQIVKNKDKSSEKNKKKTKESVALPKINPEVMELLFK